MQEIREIGIEREVFLLKRGEIIEPAKYGFPHDEMGFLIEERSEPWRHLNTVQMTLEIQHMLLQHRASFFGMDMRMEPSMEGPAEWVNNIAARYNIYSFTDYTKNIYGIKDTHHLGIFPINEEYKRLTAGIHVHFSSRDTDGNVVELPIEAIVKQMDETFDEDITHSGRIPGEWEPKKHGFEYRSLPCDMDIQTVLQAAFKILRDA